MAEVEEWLRFTDVFSAWLALIELCQQAEALSGLCHREDRGLELLRSVSKRQGSTVAGYETMRFICQLFNYLTHGSSSCS